MKISNFKLIKVHGTSPMTWRYDATIDVTTGFLFKKTETRSIHKKYVGSWYFVDTGWFTPDGEVESLARALEAKTGKELEYCETNH